MIATLYIAYKYLELSFDGKSADRGNSRFNMCSSALYPGNLRFRKIVMGEMQKLVEKFSDGYESWGEMNGEAASDAVKP